MDKPCRVVDFLKNSGPPYVPGVGYPCFSPSGEDISDKSKRDIGVMINVIITYKNKFVRVNSASVLISNSHQYVGLARMSGE